MNFVEALESLLPVIDNVYEDWAKERDMMLSQHQARLEGPQITCTKGCGACCYFPLIPATAGEAFVLLARLLAEGHTTEQLHQQFMPYARKYLESAKKQNSLPMTDSQQRLFLKEKLPCPLFISTPETGPLGGHCSVFPFRPQICDFFHSVDSPELCVLKKPHGSFSDISEQGLKSIEDIRMAERKIFGRSALGHLPLLVAALLTEDGLQTFLTVVEPDGSIENSQDIEDFGLYVSLLSCLGYSWGEGDWSSLAKAQDEVL
jgi:Fe-S-cluster containining protein